MGELSPQVTERARPFPVQLQSVRFPQAPLPGGELPPQRLRGCKWRTEKKSLSEAARFFPVRLPLWGLKGASSPFLVDPARRNRWLFSGSLLQPKENKPRRRCISQKASSLPHAKPLCAGSRNPPSGASQHAVRLQDDLRRDDVGCPAGHFLVVFCTNDLHSAYLTDP